MTDIPTEIIHLSVTPIKAYFGFITTDIKLSIDRDIPINKKINPNAQLVKFRIEEKNSGNSYATTAQTRIHNGKNFEITAINF
jgi:hypothetical protein